MRLKAKKVVSGLLLLSFSISYATLMLIWGNTKSQISFNTLTESQINNEKNIDSFGDRIERSVKSFVDLNESYQNQLNISKTSRTHLTTLNDVFISVKTTKIFHSTRLDIILKTWFTLAKDQTFIFTDANDSIYNEKSGGHLINTNCSSSHNRKALCCKMSVEFDTFIESKKRWFCHFDDDNYVNVPQLVNLLQKYNPLDDWYLGKPSIIQPLQILNRNNKQKKIAFWFATGGAGFCLSRALALKMMPIASGGKFISIGEKIRLPDDVTLGYIIEHLLGKKLTVIDKFHSHLEPMKFVKMDSLSQQITFSYSRYGQEMNVLLIDEHINKRNDPTRHFGHQKATKSGDNTKFGLDMKQELSAFEFKDEGNKCYNLHKYEEAINCYSRAINRNSSIATFFTNRALCYLKLQSWQQSCEDSRRALDIEPNLIKGHFFLGQALLEMDHYDDAIKHLQRAHDLAKEQKLNFGDEIAYQLRLARKKRFNVVEEKRIKEEIELQTYLNRLIEMDRSAELNKFRSDVDNNAIVDENTIQELTHMINITTDKRLSDVNSMFSVLDMRRKKRDVPDYLCGKISFEIMHDPVITPSGITYDRKDIEEHLQRVGHFDPVTRTPLTSDHLVPNLSMKEVIDTFLLENEWANDY